MASPLQPNRIAAIEPKRSQKVSSTPGVPPPAYCDRRKNTVGFAGLTVAVTPLTLPPG